MWLLYKEKGRSVWSHLIDYIIILAFIFFKLVNHIWIDVTKEMATHSSILAWRIPWIEEPGGLQSRCCCEVTSVVSNSVRPHRWQPTRLYHPWDSPGKNTGVGCHFLLQCMKVKSESEVAQSCPTRRDPMDCSLPGSSVHGIFQASVLEWVAIAFSIIFC